MLFKKKLFSFLLLITLQSVFAEQNIIPPLRGPVIDEAKLLTPAQEQALSRELLLYPPYVQLQIWIVKDLLDEPIESLSIRAADSWKLGTEKSDNGALLLVAVDNRKMRIEVGQGLEAKIPDAIAGRLLDHVLRPLFRQGDFYGGLHLVSRKIFEYAGGDLQVLPQDKSLERIQRQQKSSGWELLLFLLFFVIFFLNFLFPFFGRSRRRFGSHWGPSSFGSGGWSGGGGSWGGGSSWGGDGGGFSGGGSSSSW